MHNSLLYKIGLTLIKGVGVVTAKNLIAHLGNAEAVFKESQSSLKKIPDIGPVLAQQIASANTLLRAEKELNFIEKNNIQTAFYTDKHYPFRLKECADSPVILYYKGNVDLNKNRFVGMVGTRHATEYGKALCSSFVSELASLAPDVCIVSGLAYGIDIHAHKNALLNNLPTIAVLAHGLDRIYPATNRPTAVKMLEKGALLTEFITETNPDRQNFVTRNRIVAGLCDAMIVVESAIKGGSLITAELTQSYNRDVFAFPGKAGDEYSAGCNALIKANKAALIETADDFVLAMGWESNKKQKAPIQPTLFVDLTDDEQQIISLLRKEDIQLNLLSVQLSMPISRLSPILLNMEFKGLIKRTPGDVYKLR